MPDTDRFYLYTYLISQGGVESEEKRKNLRNLREEIMQVNRSTFNIFYFHFHYGVILPKVLFFKKSRLKYLYL